jgi:predicted permease
MLDAVLKDVRYAARGVGRSPGFFTVAALSLGLGAGVNTAMFSLVDSLLFRPLPVTSPDTLVDVFTTGGDGDEYATSSFPDFEDLKAQNTVFSDMTGYSPMLAPLNLGDRSRIAFGQVVTSNHFSMLGVKPLLGRMLASGDDRPGADRVVVLSHRMWQREFGGDRTVLGRTLTLRGLAYNIVGVAPASFLGVIPMLAPELWLPIAHVEEVEPAGITDAVASPTGRTRLERRGTRWMFVKGRLKPGVSAAQAQAHVALIGRQLEAAHPQTNRDRKLSAIPTEDVRLLVPQAGTVLSIGAAGLMTIVGLVLLIACANVAGMLLARASARGREIGVRLAVGASRRRLLQQLLVEGLLLGVLGAATALVCAWAVLRSLLAVELPLPVDVPLDVRLDVRVIMFALSVAVVSGLLASLVPALRVSRPNLVQDLRGDDPSARRAGRRWALRDSLVAAQMALSVVLLVVAGLLSRSLGASERASVGFEPHGLAALAFDTDMVRYTPERGLQFWRDALARVRAMPGVVSAGLVSPTLPFTLNFNQTEMQIDNRTYVEGQRAETIENVTISPGYLDTLGVKLLAGRDVSATDVDGAPGAILVNETMARRYWPGESALGRTVRLVRNARVFRVAGIVADHKRHGVLEAPSPFVYFAEAQPSTRYNFVLARTAGDALALVAAMKRELLAMEPGLVFLGAQTMEQNMAATLVPARVGAWLATAFGALGTLLAATGLYGVIAFSVARRTREIGVRMALGAEPSGVLAMVMRQGLGLVATGLAIGGLLAVGTSFVLRSVLFGVTPLDPWAWMLALLVLVVASGIANAVPARRAMRVQPLTALRTE